MNFYKILRILYKISSGFFKNSQDFLGRYQYFSGVFKDFLEVCSKSRGEINAELIAAKELNGEEITKVKNELAENFGSNIKLNYKHDPSLIGGLIIQIGSVMVDTSIKNKLQKIENKMIGA